MSFTRPKFTFLLTFFVSNHPHHHHHHHHHPPPIQDLLWTHGGRKVHYSHSFYDKEFFYSNLYDGERYAALRGKYCPDAALPDVYDKIVTKDGQL